MEIIIYKSKRTNITEYAQRNTDINVVVVDMCPQANVSEILLGGNGKGQEKLDEFFSKDLTIASYLKEDFQKVIVF